MEGYNELEIRRADSVRRLQDMRNLLSESEKLISGTACVYATGSFGRQEAGENSDLDLFILSESGASEEFRAERRFRRLDEICLKADLIKVTKNLRIPDFDGDGRYLEHYTIDSLIRTLGKPEDDALNTFTARLLLLLESTPLLGKKVYNRAIDEVIAAYWGDYEDHKDDFIPAYLANDILRLWRTFCVNYEARTERQPEEKKIKRKIKNFTLKYSRQLTCYSGILYLLAVFRHHKTVSPEDVRKMAGLTPTSRLEFLLESEGDVGTKETLRGLLSMYQSFLALKSDTKRLREEFANKDRARGYMLQAGKFGELMFDAINHIGQGNRLHRLLVV